MHMGSGCNDDYFLRERLGAGGLEGSEVEETEEAEDVFCSYAV